MRCGLDNWPTRPGVLRLTRRVYTDPPRAHDDRCHWSAVRLASRTRCHRMTPTGNRYVTPRKGRRFGAIDNCRVVDDGKYIGRLVAWTSRIMIRISAGHKAEKMLKNCAF
jgi:hypothetical protein